MFRNFFKRSRRRGAQAVEFALTAPILIILVAGTVDYGWFFHHRIVLVDAVAQGAKAASFEDTSVANIADAVANDVWTAAGFDTTVTVNAVISGTSPDEIVTVTGTAQYTCLFCLLPMTVNNVSYDLDKNAQTMTHVAVQKYQL